MLLSQNIGLPTNSSSAVIEAKNEVEALSQESGKLPNQLSEPTKIEQYQATISIDEALTTFKQFSFEYNDQKLFESASFLTDAWLNKDITIPQDVLEAAKLITQSSQELLKNKEIRVFELYGGLETFPKGAVEFIVNSDASTVIEHHIESGQIKLLRNPYASQVLPYFGMNTMKESSKVLQEELFKRYKATSDSNLIEQKISQIKGGSQSNFTRCSSSKCFINLALTNEELERASVLIRNLYPNCVIGKVEGLDNAEIRCAEPTF